MRAYACIPIRVLSLSILFLAGVSSVLGQDTGPGSSEAVRLSYELMLTRCKGASCQPESAGKGEIKVQLEAESKSFAWGNEGAQVRIGKLTYYLRFKASRRLKGRQIERALDIGFAGRMKAPSGSKQVTWADKLFISGEWKTFPKMSVSGKTYPDGEEMISPSLEVTTLPSDGDHGSL